MECLFAPFVCARISLSRLVAKLMSSAVFGSSKHLYDGGKRNDPLVISQGYLPSDIRGAGMHELACPS